MVLIKDKEFLETHSVTLQDVHSTSAAQIQEFMAHGVQEYDEPTKRTEQLQMDLDN